MAVFLDGPVAAKRMEIANRSGSPPASIHSIKPSTPARRCLALRLRRAWILRKHKPVEMLMDRLKPCGCIVLKIHATIV